MNFGCFKDPQTDGRMKDEKPKLAKNKLKSLKVAKSKDNDDGAVDGSVD